MPAGEQQLSVMFRTSQQLLCLIALVFWRPSSIISPSDHHTTLSPLPSPPLLTPLKLPLHPIRWKQTHTYSITHTISTAIVTVSACNHIHQHHHHHHSIYCHHQHTQSLAQENTALQRPSFSTVGVFIHVTHRGTVHNLGMWCQALW